MGFIVFRPEKLAGAEPAKGMPGLQFLLIGVGTAFLFSASWHFADAVFDDPFRIWRRQLVWVLLGTVAGIVVYRVPLDYIKKSVPILVWVALLLNLMTYVPGVGYLSGGARRWIEIYGLTFQPSELTRVVLILYLARMLTKNRDKLINFRDTLLPPLLVVSTLVATVYFQNDFSTVAFFLVLTLMLLFVAGVSGKVIGVLSISGILVSLAMLAARPYRLSRILSWLIPEADPGGSGYQVLKARMALERGGVWGRGVGQGIVKRGGLPSAHSDFVVAVVGEETGFLGISLVMLLFIILAIKGWAMVAKIDDVFSRWGGFGIVTAIFWQALVNFSVVSGVLPATGIPLPLFSAGGSSVFMTLVSFGLVFNLAKGKAR